MNNLTELYNKYRQSKSEKYLVSIFSFNVK